MKVIFIPTGLHEVQDFIDCYRVGRVVIEQTREKKNRIENLKFSKTKVGKFINKTLYYNSALQRQSKILRNVHHTFR